MRGFVVYESMFGNTARIARAIADGLQRHFDVEVRGVDDGIWPAGADLVSTQGVSAF